MSDTDWKAVARVLAEWWCEDDDRAGWTPEQLIDMAIKEAEKRAES